MCTLVQRRKERKKKAKRVPRKKMVAEPEGCPRCDEIVSVIRRKLARTDVPRRGRRAALRGLRELRAPVNARSPRSMKIKRAHRDSQDLRGGKFRAESNAPVDLKFSNYLNDKLTIGRIYFENRSNSAIRAISTTIYAQT